MYYFPVFLLQFSLSALHDSFGSPPTNDGHSGKRPSSPTLQNQSKPSNFVMETTDRRLPGFATSTADWTPSVPKSKNKTGSSRSKSERVDKLSSSLRQKDSSSLSTELPRDQKSSKTVRTEDSRKGRQSGKLSSGSSRTSREDISSSKEDISSHK